MISGTDKVYLPGSPVVLTLSALLKEAEKEVQMTPGWNKAGNIFATPTPLPARAPRNLNSPSDPAIDGFSPISPFLTSTPALRKELPPEAEWTKDNWRRLDSCYTDERIAVFKRGSAAFSSRSPGPNDFDTAGNEEMAAVDAVRLEDVVNQFVKMEGGWHAVQAKGWSR